MTPVTFDEAVEEVAAMLLERLLTNHDLLREIASGMIQTMISKQHDYGPENIMKFMEVGVLVRASDKVERLKNLLNSGMSPKHEAILDSWLDLGNYGIIGVMLNKDNFRLPLADSVDAAQVPPAGD